MILQIISVVILVLAVAFIVNTIDDIRKDAEKVRPYDAMYDMYYDEFDDAEVAQ